MSKKLNSQELFVCQSQEQNVGKGKSGPDTQLTVHKSICFKNQFSRHTNLNNPTESIVTHAKKQN